MLKSRQAYSPCPDTGLSDLPAEVDRLLRETEEYDRRIKFGPAADSLPARFSGVVALGDVRFAAELAFDGVQRARLERFDITCGTRSLTPTDVVGTAVAEIVRVLCAEHLELTDLDALDRDCRLAQMYWRAYVCWGHPRQTVMEAFDLSRSNASNWIRRARGLYVMPGPHALGAAG